MMCAPRRSAAAVRSAPALATAGAAGFSPPPSLSLPSPPPPPPGEGVVRDRELAPRPPGLVTLEEWSTKRRGSSSRIFLGSSRASQGTAPQLPSSGLAMTQRQSLYALTAWRSGATSVASQVCTLSSLHHAIPLALSSCSPTRVEIVASGRAPLVCAHRQALCFRTLIPSASRHASTASSCNNKNPAKCGSVVGRLSPWHHGTPRILRTFLGLFLPAEGVSGRLRGPFGA